MMNPTHAHDVGAAAVGSICSRPILLQQLYIELRLVMPVIPVSQSMLRRKAKQAEIDWIATGADLGSGYSARRTYIDWNAARLWLVANGYADPYELLARQTVVTQRRILAALTLAESRSIKGRQAS